MNLCLVSNQFFIVRTIPCTTFHDLSETTTTICFNCYYSLHFYAYTITIVRSIDLYNRDLQTTIKLFTRNVSSHIRRCLLCPCPFISQCKQSNEYVWRRMSLPSRNLYKCKQVACSVVVACLLLKPFFILMLLLYFSLFIDVNKPLIFGFKSFLSF